MNDSPRPVGPDGDRPPRDEDLRRLLHGAVSDVEPRNALDSIHARTEVSPMNSKRSWFLAAGAAVVATAATITAVTVLGGDTPSSEDPDFAAPSATPTPSPSTAEEPTTDPEPSEAPPAQMQTVPVYYAGDTSRGVRLYREFHRVEVTSEDEVVTAAVNQAVAADPDDPDYRTSWPDGTAASARSLSSTPDVLTIDISNGAGLRTRPAGMSEEEARIAVEQLIYTAQAADQSRKPVQFLLDSGRTDQLLGVPVSEPLAQGDAMDVLAQVWVIEPAEGAELTTPFTVSGLAAAFEANVVWEIRQGDTVVADGFTTADECCTMAPYSFQVDDLPPGDYTLVVQDTDPSGGEGFAPWQDTKAITVTD